MLNVLREFIDPNKQIVMRAFIFSGDVFFLNANLFKFFARKNGGDFYNVRKFSALCGRPDICDPIRECGTQVLENHIFIRCALKKGGGLSVII